MRRSESQVNELLGINDKVVAAREQLRNLNVEITTVQARREGIRREIEQEQTKAAHERKKELVIVEDEHNARLKVLKGGLERARNELVPLERRKIALESELSDLTNALSDGRATLIELVRGQNEAIAASEQAQLTMEATNNKITYLKGQIEPLQIQEAALKDAISALEARHATLEGSLSAMRNEYEAKKDEYDKSISRLEFKRTELANILVGDSQQLDLARQELVEREIALNERDSNLRAREFKVEQGESKIAQNANLLNL